MIQLLIGIVIGFLAGVLVYRNNAAKAEREAKELKAKLDSVIAQAAELVGRKDS